MQCIHQSIYKPTPADSRQKKREKKPQKNPQNKFISSFRKVKGLVFSFGLNIACNNNKYFMPGAIVKHSTRCSLSHFFPLDPCSYLQGRYFRDYPCLQATKWCQVYSTHPSSLKMLTILHQYSQWLTQGKALQHFGCTVEQSSKIIFLRGFIPISDVFTVATTCNQIIIYINLPLQIKCLYSASLKLFLLSLTITK